MGKPKYAVVVVHGIGAGTGDERKGFSNELRAGAVKCNPECDKFWFEAPWEGLNDSVDEVVKGTVDELFDSYIKEAEETKRRTEQWAEQQDVSGRLWIVRFFKKLCVWTPMVISGIMPDALRKAKKITPGALDAILDLPIYLGKAQSEDIRRKVFEKIDEAMDGGTEGVVLVGHSLGSVIAFDVLQDELRNGARCRIKALVTIGSPLEWVTKIRNAMTSGETNELSFDVRGTRWINYYDPQDPVPIRRALSTSVFNGVENVEDVSGKILIDAHCAYWKSSKIAKKIAELMCGGL